MAKTGRPKLQFNLEEVEKLARFHCSYCELASFFGCSTETIERRMKEDEKFCAAFEKGKGEGKLSLRRAQFKSALNGNVTMQIWLGKQLLGQTDKQVVENEITMRGPLVITKHNGKEPEGS